MFFNEYPYRNLTDLNLDYLLKQIKYLTQQITDFVNINSIKYADPIQWNITKQYEKNTVVIDGNTGTAYLSVQAVPNGIALTNTDYWTVIFTLDILAANHNITAHDAGGNPTATFASDEGDWILWNAILYKAIRPIVLHEAYLVGYNLTATTVDDFVHEYVTALTNNITALTNNITALANKVGDLTDLNTTDKTNLVNAINEVLSTITTVAGDLTDLNTTDKSNLVNAINEVLSTITTVAGDLTDLNTTDKSNLVNAINEVLSTITTVAGDLTDLNTTDKSNLVNAINEVLSTLRNVVGDLNDLTTTDKNSAVNAINEINSKIDNMTSGIYYNVQDYGAKGDGVTDDTQAFNAAIAAAHQTNGVVFVPDVANFYLITSALVLGSKSYILGEKEAEIHFTSENLFSISDYYGSIENLVIQGNNTNNAVFFDLDTAVVYIWRFNHLHIKNCVHAFYDNVSGNKYIADCIFNDINCDYTYGTQFLSHRSRGFITLRNFKADNTNNLRDIAWDSIVITDVIGVEMEAVDVVGPVTRGDYTVDTYQNVWGIKITGTTDGKASIWLSRVLVDTTPMNGILISNVNYINGNYVEAFGIVGTGILITNCEEGNITNIMCRGGKGVSYAPAGANGIQLQNCKKFNLANVISQYNTGTGVSIYGDEKVHITNAVSENNGAYGYLELDGNGGNVLVGGSLVGNVTNVSQNNANSALSNVLVGSSLEVSRVGTYSA